MSPLLIYIGKVFFISGILYGYYLLFLRNKRFNSYNRFYLLSTLVLSVAAPLINFSHYRVNLPAETPGVRLVIEAVDQRLTESADLPGWTIALPIVTSCITISLIFVCAIKIKRILRIKRTGKCVSMEGFDFVETSAPQAPFSFLDTLFWPQGVSTSDSNGAKIFAHELTHIRQRHTYDKLFAQLILSIFWMNPFFWLIEKELNMVHEFIADDAAIDPGDTESFALMLLQSYSSGTYLVPSHSFFTSSIKRRLTMITSPRKITYSNWRRVMCFPMAALLFMLVSATVNAQAGDSLDHIEVHGVTGIGDTAIVYFKGGSTERYVLNNAADNKVFQQKYGAALRRQQGRIKEPKRPGRKDSSGPIRYQPVSPVPEEISEITFGREMIWLKLNTGVSEQYDLRNEQDVKSFETRYGKLNIKRDI